MSESGLKKALKRSKNAFFSPVLLLGPFFFGFFPDFPRGGISAESCTPFSQKHTLKTQRCTCQKPVWEEIAGGSDFPLFGHFSHKGLGQTRENPGNPRGPKSRESGRGNSPKKIPKKPLFSETRYQKSRCFKIFPKSRALEADFKMNHLLPFREFSTNTKIGVFWPFISFPASRISKTSKIWHPKKNRNLRKPEKYSRMSKKRHFFSVNNEAKRKNRGFRLKQGFYHIKSGHL